jgi:hypothetical protein
MKRVAAERRALAGTADSGPHVRDTGNRSRFAARGCVATGQLRLHTDLIRITRRTGTLTRSCILVLIIGPIGAAAAQDHEDQGKDHSHGSIVAWDEGARWNGGHMRRAGAGSGWRDPVAAIPILPAASPCGTSGHRMRNCSDSRANRAVSSSPRAASGSDWARPRRRMPSSSIRAEWTSDQAAPSPLRTSM